MSIPLHILILEDCPADAELALHALRRAGFTSVCQRVETEAEYLAALDPTLDLILADYSLPQFDALRALELLRECGLDIPFIIVSGTIGEEIAVAAMQQGAADYVLKDRLARLGGAVTRALEQRRLRVEMQRAEAALQANARLNLAVLSSLTAKIAVLDSAGTIIAVNEAWEQFALTHGDPLLHATGVGINYLAVCRRAADHNDAVAATTLAGLKALLDGDQPQFAQEYSYQTSIGQLWFAMHATPLANHGGIVITHEDISDRKRVEMALHRSERVLKLFVEHAPAAIAMLDRNMVYITASRRYLADYRLTKQSITGESHYAIFPEISERWKEIHQRCLAGESAKAEEDAFPRQDGRLDWVRWEIHPWYESPTEIGGLILFSEVITERKRFEEQMLQAQKMESVGQLAGGVAHDFNNLLTVISGYADFVLAALPTDSPVHSDIEEIIKASDRAATLTRQLLAFARKQMIEPRVLDLNDLIGEIEKLLQRLLGETIDLVTLPTSDLGQVKADPGQIEQVMVNLVLNARDAMPDGGRLTIEMRNVELDQAYAQQHVEVTPGQYVSIAVGDSGTGMDDYTQQHAFEPFFTTKEPGRGTGLGLATCYGIVKQHGGHIAVASRLHQGTTFTVYLPRVASSDSLGVLHDAMIDLPQGNETVLLAEDNPAVRALAARVLRDQGYRVLEAADGKQALYLAQSFDGAPIQLLLTDLVMPQLDGRRLFERLNERWPELRALFISGYADHAIVRHSQLDPGIAFLHKPFSPVELVRKVREVLDRGR